MKTTIAATILETIAETANPELPPMDGMLDVSADLVRREEFLNLLSVMQDATTAIVLIAVLGFAIGLYILFKLLRR